MAYKVKASLHTCLTDSHAQTARAVFVKERAALISSRTKWMRGNPTLQPTGEASRWVVIVNQKLKQRCRCVFFFTVLFKLKRFPFCTCLSLHTEYKSTTEEDKYLLFRPTVVIHHSGVFLCASLTLCLSAWRFLPSLISQNLELSCFCQETDGPVFAHFRSNANSKWDT